VSLSGYGEDGPMRDKKADDLLIQGDAGLVLITGTPDETAKGTRGRSTEPKVAVEDGVARMLEKSRSRMAGKGTHWPKSRRQECSESRRRG
jgi:crotonobetainyl-CoA:carnitine CoA-transferase CaiB-like acyl-CoA transferase